MAIGGYPIYKSNSGVCLCVCLSFLFFSFTSHVSRKKGLFTKVTTYNRPSVFFFSIYFIRFGEKKTVYKGDHVQCRVTCHPPIDRLLLTHSLSSSFFLFFFLFFSFTSHILGKKGLFTRVTMYNAGSLATPPIDRLLLTHSLYLFLFLFLFFFFSFSFHLLEFPPPNQKLVFFWGGLIFACWREREKKKKRRKRGAL